MDKQKIEKNLKQLGVDCTIYHYETIDSTNNKAKELALHGCAEGCVVIAEHQTAGKGRLGRSFFSPDKTGLYMSIVMRPCLEAKHVCLITPAVAVAVSNVLKNELKLNVMIKWVNDIYLDGKKVCGILTESAFDKNGKIEYAVVGIGINVAYPEKDFPSELSNIAGALFEKIPENLEFLYAQIINSTISLCKALPDKSFLKSYRERQMLLNKCVFLPSGEEVTVVGIDEECGLLVKYEDGTTASIKTGEVSVKLK